MILEDYPVEATSTRCVFDAGPQRDLLVQRCPHQPNLQDFCGLYQLHRKVHAGWLITKITIYKKSL